MNMNKPLSAVLVGAVRASLGRTAAKLGYTGSSDWDADLR
jgi:hypothetical protein